MKYKVGDPVRVDGWDYVGNRKNAIGKIVDLTCGGYDVEFEDGKTLFFTDEHILELVKESKDSKEFKVGDRVWCNQHSDTGTIIQVDIPHFLVQHDNWTKGHGGMGRVKAKRGYCYYEDRSDLEKIESEEEVRVEKEFVPILSLAEESSVTPFDAARVFRTINEYYQQLIMGDFAYGVAPKKESKMSQAVNFIKTQALKATNPDEYELGQAGLHNDCGELTSEGEALHQEFLRELTKEKMVTTAKELNAEKKTKKE